MEDGLVHPRDDLLGDIERRLGIVDPVQQHGEFVPAEAGDHRTCRHGILDPSRGFAQHRVAHTMTIGVVDRFEVVEINIKESDHPVRIPPIESALHRGVEKAAVRKVR